MSRTSLLVRSKWNWLLGKAENHSEQLDFAYESMLRDLQKAQLAVRDVVAVKHMSVGQAASLRKQIGTLDAQAHEAMELGNEELAMRAVEQKVFAQAELTEAEQRIIETDREQERLMNGVRTLEARVGEMKVLKQQLKAQLRSAEAQARMAEAVTGISNSANNAGQIVERTRERIALKRAEASAVDELIASGFFMDALNPAMGIERELSAISAQGKVELEMTKLRGELPEAAKVKEISSGTD